MKICVPIRSALRNLVILLCRRWLRVCEGELSYYRPDDLEVSQCGLVLLSSAYCCVYTLRMLWILFHWLLVWLKSQLWAQTRSWSPSPGMKRNSSMEIKLLLVCTNLKQCILVFELDLLVLKLLNMFEMSGCRYISKVFCQSMFVSAADAPIMGWLVHTYVWYMCCCTHFTLGNPKRNV